MKVTYIDPIESASGAICKKSAKPCVLTHRKYGNGTVGNYGSHYHDGFGDGGNSNKQIAWRATFKAAIVSAKTKLQDQDQRKTLEAAYKAQTKYKTLLGYVVAKELAR